MRRFYWNSGSLFRSPLRAWHAYAAICALCFPFVGRADTVTAAGTAKTAEAVSTSAHPLLANIPPDAASKNGSDGIDVVPKPTPEGSKPADAKAAPPFRPSFAIGGDLYMGGSNVTGVSARNNDGIWAGYGPAFPSNLSLNWKETETRTLRVSIGVGDMYTGRGTALRQPVEAFYQLPGRGGSSFTLGKFYVPFATQEWEYEPKWGGMVQGASGRMGYTASINYDRINNSPNGYLRLGRQWSSGTTAGLSLAGGRGVFFGASYDRALGFDLTQEFKGVRLNTEYNLADSRHGAFQFAFGKLTFTRFGKFEPYVGVYYTGDHAAELGNFFGFHGGVNYHITRSLALEGGYGTANNRNVFWFLSHASFCVFSLTGEQKKSFGALTRAPNDFLFPLPLICPPLCAFDGAGK